MEVKLIKCETCLSCDRQLVCLTKIQSLINELQLAQILGTNGGVCWECHGEMMRYCKFGRKVKRAQDILFSINIEDQQIKSLSNLTNCIKLNYDFEYIHCYDPLLIVNPDETEIDIKNEPELVEQEADETESDERIYCDGGYDIIPTNTVFAECLKVRNFEQDEKITGKKIISQNQNKKKLKENSLKKKLYVKENNRDNKGQEEIWIPPDSPGLNYPIGTDDISVTSSVLGMTESINLSKLETLIAGEMLCVSEPDSEASDKDENFRVVLPSKNHPDNQAFIHNPVEGSNLTMGSIIDDHDLNEGTASYLKRNITNSNAKEEFTLSSDDHEGTMQETENNNGSKQPILICNESIEKDPCILHSDDETHRSSVETTNNVATKLRRDVSNNDLDYDDVNINVLRQNILENTDKPLKKTSQRSWNRRNCCIYCENLVSNYTRHLIRNHPNEIEVQKLIAIRDPNPKEQKKKRQAITDDLRNRGNYIHNSMVVSRNEGSVIPARRNNDEELTKSPSNFVVCKKCLGTYRRSTFYRHSKKCNSDIENDLKMKYTLARHALSIIPFFTHASKEFQENILPRLRHDEISLIVKQDPLITAYGCRLLKKKKERISRKSICSKLRDLAKLLKIVREKNPDIAQLQDLIDPEYYESFIEAVKLMSGFNEETGFVKVISIPTRIRPEILGCIEILFSNTIRDGYKSIAVKDHIKKKLSEFKLLLEANWQWEISSNAEKTRKRNLITNSQVMPLEKDIEKVMIQIHELEEKYYESLIKDITNVNYENLCEVTIAHIILLDRKQCGDVAEAELQYYLNRKTDEITPQVLETLDRKQKQAISDSDIFQIPSKRGRSVPIPLTEIMSRNINVIIACRSTLNIPSINKYLFARPLTEEPFDGGRCLSKIKSMCDLKKTEMLTSTGLRHNIATISQVHAKTDGKIYTQHLATFLGHDKPIQAIQKGLVGSRLLDIEKYSKNKENANEQGGHSKNNENDKFGDESEVSICEHENVCNIENKIKPDKTSYFKKSKLNEMTETDEYDEQNENDVCINESTRTETQMKQIMDRKPKRIKEKVQRLQSSDIERSIEMPLKRKKNTRGIYKILTDDESNEEAEEKQKRKRTHTKWSSAEIEAVMRHLNKYILLKKNPGKALCEEVLRKEAVLHKRTWMQINTYINNIYKKNL